MGSGPNGLAAAVTLARAGWSVLVREGSPALGGGARSAELTLRGYVHDLCASVVPLAAGSPFFRGLDLDVDYVQPAAAFAHPLDGGEAAVCERAVEATAARLGPDGEAYRRLVGPLVESWGRLEPDVLGPLLRRPERPLDLARFGLAALRSAEGLARARFGGEPARALMGGAAAHSALPLERAGTAAFGLVLTVLGHVVGWPVVRGGSQRLADALAARLEDHGGRIELGAPVASLAELPAARAVLCDVTPAQLLRLAGDRLPAPYRRRLARWRYGPGAFKLDYALSAPIPWASTECHRVTTVHVGGTLAEIALSERTVAAGRVPERPFVLVAQPTAADPTRTPDGGHTAWAYCHVPNSWPGDATAAIESQLERFAPGFRDVVLARAVSGPADLERRNPNLVGGDINAGAQDLRQLVARPVLSPVPYRTPVRGLYLCSAATPPGGGVHGMCGHLAARAALADLS